MYLAVAKVSRADRSSSENSGTLEIEPVSPDSRGLVHAYRAVDCWCVCTVWAASQS
jgi:hypothetical protein